MKIVRPSVSQKKLRELARRALRVSVRHLSDVGVKVTAAALVPAAEAYIKVYDDAIKYQSTQDSEMKQGREGLTQLEMLLKSSVAIVSQVVPGFDAGEMTGTVETPDRLLANAQRIVELLAHAGSHVPDGQTLLDALKATVEKAEQSWSEAQASRVELQQNQAVVRAHAIAFNDQLIALRRILRAVVGTNHIDYQMLRTSRVPGPVEDTDDSVVEETAADPLATDDAIVTNSNATTNGDAHNGAGSNGADHNTAFATGVNA